MNEAATPDESYRVTAQELQSFVERYERLESERADILEGMKEVTAELKSRGYDTKAFKTIIRLRKQDPSDVSEQEAIVEMYKEAMGMV